MSFLPCEFRCAATATSSSQSGRPFSGKKRLRQRSSTVLMPDWAYLRIDRRLGLSPTYNSPFTARSMNRNAKSRNGPSSISWAMRDGISEGCDQFSMGFKRIDSAGFA